MSTALGAAVVGTLAVLAPRTHAQGSATLGPNECLTCHDHEAERAWSNTGEQKEVQRLFPDRGKQAGHLNSLNQLEDPKAKEFAAAVGLTSADGPYDAKGLCVTCHAVDTKASNGVSCENCHGPAGSYITTHKRLADQKPRPADGYEQDVRAGMRDIVGKPELWARQCMTCHVMKDAKYAALVKAGHPNGDKFDLAVKYQPVALHFHSGKNKYTRENLATVWARLTTASAPVVTVTPPAPPKPESTPPPAPAPTKPEPVSAKPESVPAKPERVAPKREPVAPKPEPAPPKPEPVPAPPPAPAPVPPAVTPPPRPRAMTLAEAQGQVIVKLTALVAKGATVPMHLETTLTAAPVSGGPDAALLQLQADAIALAREVLSQPAKAPGKK